MSIIDVIGLVFLVGLFMYNFIAILTCLIEDNLWIFSIPWCINQIIKGLNIPRSFSSDVQTITFEQFYNLYSIKPEHWDLYYNYVVYNNISSPQKYCYSTIEFKTFRDLEQYYSFKKELETKKRNKKWAEERERLVKSWQYDIEQYREQTIQEAAKSLKAIEDERSKAVERFNNRGEVV